jgi:hypothetical protein
MTTTVPGAGRAAIAERTLRTDRWWFPPAIQAAGLTAWVAYATFRVFQQSDYFVEKYNYLTPFYSPCMSEQCVEGSSHFGQFLPANLDVMGFDVMRLIPFAVVTLPFLLLFRLTCYYYRKAYYRAFWMSPPACAVAEPHGKYTGETRFPLLLQNLHRYFFYVGLLYPVILLYDAAHSVWARDDGGYVGLGTIILVVNALLLAMYSMSCHSCRHLIGGRLVHFSKHPIRYKLWTWVSRENSRHMKWAWISLVVVAAADFYVRLLATGAFDDPILF